MKHFYLFIFVALFSQCASPKSAIEKKKIQRAEALLNIKITPSLTPKKEVSILMNDPSVSQQWGIAKTGLTQAWKISQGSRNIKVAVIDTGIDTSHEDLKDNLWVNKGETGRDRMGRDKQTNGIDDDKNGFVDDVHGWNFVGNNNDLTDNHKHGTHVAGIIGAKGGNSKGIVGASPNVSLMVLKYYDPKVPGTDHLSNTVKAIHYAVDQGAQIINYSGGGLEYSQAEKDAIIKAQKKGILFVAAAGNERSNSDTAKYYPASYDLDNIISVTAIDPSLKILASSNYGAETVDIAAPGHQIISTVPGSKYGKMTGTSQATPWVSGVAALLMSIKTDFNYKTIAKHIMMTGDLLPTLGGKTAFRRKLNSYKALSIIDSGVGVTGVVTTNTQDLKLFGPQNTNTSFGLSSLSQSLKKL